MDVGVDVISHPVGDPGADTRNLDQEEDKMYNNVHYEDRTVRREKSMREVSFTEFRRNAASYFNSVEKGETIRVVRHGRPIAEIVPVSSPERILSWKRPGLLLDAGAASLSREILRERKGTQK